MPQIGEDSDCNFSASNARLSVPEIGQLSSDPATWGEPLSYVDLLTHPAVQSRIGKLIVRSTLKRSRQRW